jgi:hypothetical protein
VASDVDWRTMNGGCSCCCCCCYGDDGGDGDYGGMTRRGRRQMTGGVTGAQRTVLTLQGCYWNHDVKEGGC